MLSFPKTCLVEIPICKIKDRSEEPTGTMEYLPREVAVNILSRLPITSLLQCKLVCRVWRSLTQDPFLVSMRFSRLGENDLCLILRCDHPIRNQLYSLELSAHSDDNLTVNKIRVPMLPQFNIVGSCKGLLCLIDSSKADPLYIYNPFTRDIKQLPKSIEFQISPEFQIDKMAFGFGFHPITKEYKVLKIVCHRTRQLSFHDLGKISSPEPKVQIFTLGSPAWRSLGKLDYNFFHRPYQVLVSGRFHWRSWPWINGRYCVIMSFDLADEQFRVIPKPDCGGLDKCSYYLVVLHGLLSAAVRCYDGQIEIWVMKDYDVKESWTKEFSIGIQVPRGLEQDVATSFRASKSYYDSLMFRVVCLLKNGNILLEYKSRALLSYDPTTGTFEELFFNGLNWSEIVVHEGNLTLVDI